MILPKGNLTDRFCYLGWSTARLHNPSVAEGERRSCSPAFGKSCGAAEVVVRKWIVELVVFIPLENGSTW